MELKNMNGFCELTQEEQLVVEGGWQAVARRVIGEAALADAFVRSCELAANYIWNNRKNIRGYNFLCR